MIVTEPCNGCDLCLPTNEQGLCSKCAQPPMDKAVASADHMHPTGRCTCAGEGTCEWCADAAAREVDHPADATVQSPPHYKVHSIEPIDVIESWGLGFRLGNTVKYIARADHKGSRLDDLRKARWYLDREIQKAGG